MFDHAIPKVAGKYLNRCSETEYEYRPVNVYFHPKYLELYVDDPDIGGCELETYHHNLTDLSWELQEAGNQLPDHFLQTM